MCWKSLSWAMIVLFVFSVSTARAEMTREQIEAGIERGVKLLLSKQEPDGHWFFKMENGKEIYPVGYTSLAVLALQHSGSKNPEVPLAIKKGVSYILQAPPEAMTYTSGLVMQVLYNDNPKGNSRLLGAYAWMVVSSAKRNGPQSGSWSYYLTSLPLKWNTQGPGVFGRPFPGRSDNSNSQFAILALVFAEKAGFQVPREIWARAMEYYINAQHRDGGWDYQSDVYRDSLPAGDLSKPTRPSTMAMTLAGTVSEYLCEEALADKNHRQCVTLPVNKSHEAGLKWIADNWTSANTRIPYDWYACERLGMLLGYSDFGGHDWYQEGALDLTKGAWALDTAVIGSSFSVLFLARGLHPIIINKLKRQGDWNLHRYDINHLIDHISGPWQTPCQWRIVTLDAKVDFLLKVPILWISGHEPLKFTPEEKAKLKDYVERGGTILAEDCCSKPAFNASFRALLAELWPDNALTDLPQTHPIYTSFRKMEVKLNLMVMALDKGQGRLGVIYIPNGISCRWEVGGPGAKPWLDVGACIYLYVDKMGKKMKEEPATPAPPAEPAAITP